MVEKHPYKPFIPLKPKYLWLGSFPGKVTEWYYGSPRNQLWRILEKVYGLELKNTAQKKDLLKRLNIAMFDVVAETIRTKNNNSDSNLKILKYNDIEILRLLRKYNIKRIIFSSRFAEKLFKTISKKNNWQLKIKNYTLPSPSPRYAKYTLEEKVRIYRFILPKLR